MIDRYDLAVIGAGPAGMAAACEADAAGLRVVVLDENAAPGGQIYRGVETASGPRGRILGPAYTKGAGLVARFRACGAVYRPGASVWHIEEGDNGQTLYVSVGGGSVSIMSRKLIVASGALERPVPLPGWTLPGVTTAGAMQILLKGAGGVADDLVLIGGGPLLYLIASQAIATGRPPKALVETVPRGRTLRAARHLPRALTAYRYLSAGVSMIRAIRAAGVPIYKAATGIRIEGADRAEAVRFTSGGTVHRIETGAVALHEGVVPNQQVGRLLRCDYRWDAGQFAFLPVLDEYGETSRPGIYIAGDSGGIAGATSAELSGQLAARRIAALAGAPQDGLASLRAALRRDAAIRPFLETLYAPCPDTMQPDDDTLICRCEEVTAGQIRAVVDTGATGPNQVKSLLRSGMGPCQGRVCGLAVSQIVAERRHADPDEIGYFRIRPPLKPLPLSELATFDLQAE